MVGPLNVFRLAADALHAASKLVLVHGIRKRGTAAGVSLKSQLLYFITFATRYLDVLWFWARPVSVLSVYNLAYKVFFIAVSAYTVYLVAFKYGLTYTPAIDKIPIWPLLLVPLVPAVISIFTNGASLMVFLWVFSMFLECLTLVPQISMMMEIGEASPFPVSYMACVGVYRLLYVVQWALRGKSGGWIGWVSWACGIIHTLMYGEFVYEWAKSTRRGPVSLLPVTTGGRVAKGM